MSHTLLRKSDRQAIEIYERLKRASELNPFCNSHYENILSFFMHDLMVYVTNYILISDSKFHYDQQLNFPYLNSAYCDQPLQLKNPTGSRIRKREPSTKHRLARLALFLKKIFTFFIRKKYRITILSPELFPFFDILWLHPNIGVEISENTQVYLPKLDNQKEYLKSILLDIALDLEIPKPDIFCENFIAYTSQITKNTPVAVSGDCLIVQSNSILKNRANSANFLAAGRKVIGVSHGFGYSLSLDDPYMGYAEFSYCTHYITYGSASIEFGSFNTPLGEEPKIMLRDAEFLRSLYRNDPLKSIKPIRYSRILYIPTQLSENERYGPFRDLDDQLYFRWQTQLLDHYPNICVKPFPPQIKYYEKYKDRIVHGNLLHIAPKLDDYDLIIIDFYSTVANIVMATKAQIIYFDLGLMNLASKTQLVMQKRLHWKSIDLDTTVPDQLSNAFSEYEHSSEYKTNEYTELFNLNIERTSLKQCVRQIVCCSDND